MLPFQIFMEFVASTIKRSYKLASLFGQHSVLYLLMKNNDTYCI